MAKESQAEKDRKTFEEHRKSCTAPYPTCPICHEGAMFGGK